MHCFKKLLVALILSLAQVIRTCFLFRKVSSSPCNGFPALTRCPFLQSRDLAVSLQPTCVQQVMEDPVLLLNSVSIAQCMRLNDHHKILHQMNGRVRIKIGSSQFQGLANSEFTEESKAVSSASSSTNAHKSTLHYS